MSADPRRVASPSGTGGTAGQSRRFAVGMLAVVVPAGTLLAVTHAPLWVGCVVTFGVVAILVPWIILGGTRAR